MHLVHKPDCPFCWKVRIVLHESGLPFTAEVMVPPDKDRLADLSPQATVPVLIDDGVALWDSAAAAEYVNERAGGFLMPAEAGPRARVRLLHTYADRIAGLGLREVIFEKRGAPPAQWDRERIAKGAAGWRRTLDWLEARIDGPGGFVANRLSLADCALLPRFLLAERYEVGVGRDHPRLHAWYARQRRRPAVEAGSPERFGWVSPVRPPAERPNSRK